jgi:hypothetical protein
MTPCTDSTPPGEAPVAITGGLGPEPPGTSHTAYPRSMFGKLIVLVIVVAVAFWLLTKFRNSGRGGR